jgi:hypothetical protein
MREPQSTAAFPRSHLGFVHEAADAIEAYSTLYSEQEPLVLTELREATMEMYEHVCAFRMHSVCDYTECTQV